MPFNYLKNKASGAVFASLIFTILLTSSCVKDSDSGSSTLSVISLVHASPGLPALDFYLNGNRLNGDSIIAYSDTIPYKYFYAGTSNITVKKYISSTEYINQNAVFEGGKYYTLFIAGKPDSIQGIITEDKMEIPVSGKARIRFINLSPDAPALDLRLNGDSTSLSNQSFKSYTNFISVDAKEYKLELKSSGSENQLAEKTLTLESGKNYTVIARGLLNTEDESLKLTPQIIGY